MKWTVEVTEERTGEVLDVDIDAQTREQAVARARDGGLVVRSVRISRSNLSPAPVGAVVAAGLIAAGFYFAAAFTFGTRPAEGLGYVATLGAPAVAIVFATAFAATVFLGRVTRTRFPRLIPKVLVPVSALLAVLIGAAGYHESLPRTRFNRVLNGPPPASVTDLRVVRLTSFNDGSGWFLRFDVSAADFAGLQARNNLREFVDPEAERARRAAAFESLSQDETDLLYPEDRVIRVRVRETYTRPPSPRFFKGGDGERMLVVTDSGCTQVVVFVDNFRVPPPAARGP
jgi:hypothetical protein